MSIEFSERKTIEQVEEGQELAPKFDADGLNPCITTAHESGEVLMLGYMNAEALRKTIETGDGRIRFGRGDVPVVAHFAEHVVAPNEGLIRIEERALTPGGLEDAGDQRRFRELQLDCGLSEVESSGGF